MKISIIYFLFWLKVWGLTDDEISDAADKAIEHVKHEEVEDLIANSNTLILFFGASWCPNTKRFNPKYLKVQELVKEHKLEEKGFRMRKVECTEGTGKYCQTDHHVRGYPTMKVYANGVSKREYQYSHDTESLFGYIQTLIEQHPLKDPEVLKKEQQIQELVDQKEQLEKNVQFIDLEFKSKQATLNSIEEKLKQTEDELKKVTIRHDEKQKKVSELVNEISQKDDELKKGIKENELLQVKLGSIKERITESEKIHESLKVEIENTKVLLLAKEEEVFQIRIYIGLGVLALILLLVGWRIRRQYRRGYYRQVPLEAEKLA